MSTAMIYDDCLVHHSLQKYQRQTRREFQRKRNKFAIIPEMDDNNNLLLKKSIFCFLLLLFTSFTFDTDVPHVPMQLRWELPSI